MRLPPRVYERNRSSLYCKKKTTYLELEKELFVPTMYVNREKNLSVFEVHILETHGFRFK